VLVMSAVSVVLLFCYSAVTYFSPWSSSDRLPTKNKDKAAILCLTFPAFLAFPTFSTFQTFPSSPMLRAVLNFLGYGISHSLYSL